MKALLSSVGALALMASATACDSPDVATNDRSGVTSEAPMDGVETTDAGMPVRTEYVLVSGEVEASDLIGADVHDSAGKSIASVADVWLGADGVAPMLVLRDGGVAGVGGELRTIAFNAAAITPAPAASGEEPVVTVKLSDASLENLPKFEQPSADDKRLASEMIGTNVDVSYRDEGARINDLILAASGEPRFAVVSEDLATSNQIVVDAGKVTLAEGDSDGSLLLTLTEDEFAAAQSYRRQ